jgi:hypothetical protein
MDYKFLLRGIKNIILSPAKVWETIDSKNTPVKLLRGSFLFPLIIIVSVSAFFGSIIFTNPELSIAYSIFTGIKCFVVLLITVYATTYILGEITYPLDLGKNFNVSFSLIVFSISPFILCQFLSRLLESLLFINILGLYGLYIFWIGAEKLLAPPQHKKRPLLIATSITIIGIYVTTNLILTMFIDRVYFSYFA